MWTPERIKTLRKQRLHLTQEQFARIFRLSIVAIQNWEQGRQVPSGPPSVILDMLETNPELFTERAELQPA